MKLYNARATEKGMRNAVSSNVRVGYMFIVMALAALIAWGAMFPIERFSTTSATIVTDKKTIGVMAESKSVVSEVLVKEGDYVTKGQKLLTLKDNATQKAINKTDQRIISLRAAEARLNAERDNMESVEITKELIKFNGNPVLAKSLDKEIDLFNSRLKQYKTQFVDIDKNIKMYESIIVEAEVRKTSLEDQVHGIDKKIAALSKQFSEKTRNKKKLSELSEKKKKLRKKLEHTITNISASKKNITIEKQKKLDFILARSEQAISELEKVQNEISALNTKLAELENSKLQSEIVSPVNGIVRNINNLKNQDVVLSGDNFVEISPNSNFEVLTAQIPYTNIPRLNSNQNLIIKTAGFDNSQNKITGTIEKLLPDENDGYISVQIRINAKHIDSFREIMQSNNKMQAQFILFEEPYPLLDITKFQI